MSRIEQTKRGVVLLAGLSGLVAFGALLQPPAAGAASSDARNGRILFSSTRTGADFELHTIKPNGARPRRLTANHKDDEQAKYSADGAQITFVRALGERLVGDEILRMKANGRGERQLTDNESDDRFPTFSPNGRRIAFTRRVGEGDGSFLDVFTMRRNGSDQMRIGNALPPSGPGTGGLPDNAYAASWSPSGPQIAFLGGIPFEQDELFTMRPDGSDLVRRTFMPQPRQKLCLDWSPDGRRIVFLGATDGEPDSDLYLVRADGTNARVLTRNRKDEFCPAWSPNGRRIAVSRDTRGNHLNVFTMKPNGRGVRRVTRTPSFDFVSDWQPR